MNPQFHHQQSARIQTSGDIRADPAVKIQPVRSAVQRRHGFKANFRLQVAAVRGGDIGRIGKNQIKRPSGDGREQVAFRQRDFGAEPLRVDPRDGQRVPADIRQGNGGVRTFLFDGKTDTVWCEAKYDSGIGETLTVSFYEPIKIDEIRIINGFAHKDLYKSRI